MRTKTRRQLINAISQPQPEAAPCHTPPFPHCGLPLPKMRNLLKCQAFYRSVGREKPPAPRLTFFNFYLGTAYMLHATCAPPHPCPPWPFYFNASSIIVYFGWRWRRQRRRRGKWTAIYKNALSCSADNKYEFESAARPTAAATAASRPCCGTLHAACSSCIH